jgi:beta-glucosidase
VNLPKNFIWGAATSAYQIEGAVAEDGRGQSVIDMFCRRPGAVWQGHSGEVSADHYHRWAEDVELMRGIGLQAYRFSFAWPRVLPDGTGAVNEKGLAFYDRLIDALLGAGIKPIGTLFHWDFPHALFCRGGWLNRDSPDWFADYTRVLVDRFSDRVTDWLTINEPQCIAGFGHSTGSQAPGLQLPRAEMLLVGHNLLLAHGKAVQVIRAHSKNPCQIGCAPVGVVSVPATESAADIAAARAETFSISPTEWGRDFWNGIWWIDPMVLGRYPEEGLRYFGSDVPKIHPGDLETIHQPLDFCGLNLYSAASVVRADACGAPVRLPEAVGTPRTAFHWAVTPTVLRWGPLFFQERYKLPVFVTENGLSNIDWVSLDGKVHDPQRIDFIHRHLIELGKAIDGGADVRGYLYWSLLDNFEWDHGFRERFGLIHVDYATCQRVAKDSASWYAELIRTNAANLASA